MVTWLVPYTPKRELWTVKSGCDQSGRQEQAGSPLSKFRPFTYKSPTIPCISPSIWYLSSIYTSLTSIRVVSGYDNASSLTCPPNRRIVSCLRFQTTVEPSVEHRHSSRRRAASLFVSPPNILSTMALRAILMSRSKDMVQSIITRVSNVQFIIIKRSTSVLTIT